MNNTVEKWLLAFPRYSGYSIQARWANVQADDVKFSQDLTHKKSLKSVNFWQSYLKNKKVDVFVTQCIQSKVKSSAIDVLCEFSHRIVSYRLAQTQAHRRFRHSSIASSMSVCCSPSHNSISRCFRSLASRIFLWSLLHCTHIQQ